MAEPYASTGCSDLSIDILILMVQLVELPVCAPCMTLCLYLGRHGCPTSLHGELASTLAEQASIVTEAHKHEGGHDLATSTREQTCLDLNQNRDSKAPGQESITRSEGRRTFIASIESTMLKTRR
jgi:hypothetical protein